MKKKDYKYFEMGFYDAFEGRDCKFIIEKYVDGYMKGLETAKKCGKPTYRRIY